MSPAMRNRLSKGVEACFPYEQYRDEQKRILKEASNAIQSGTDVIVIDAPTGIGKSGINMTLAKWNGDAFYTTPQKHLRDQLTDDPKLEPMHTALGARADYTCNVSVRANPVYDRSEMSAQKLDKLTENKRNCKQCSIYRSDDYSCCNFVPDCRYWTQKEKAMRDDVAALTFAYLIADTGLKTYVKTWDEDTGQTVLEPHKRQVSFDDRDLLIVDEAHTLEQQVASLHLSKTISQSTLSVNAPDGIEDGDGMRDYTGGFAFDELYDRFLLEVYNRERKIENFKADDARSVAKKLSDAIRDNRISYLEDALENPSAFDFGKWKLIQLKDNLKRLHEKLNEIQKLKNDSRTKWVLDTPDDDGPKKLVFRPIRVGWYLKEKVWNRAETIVLSSATIPYQSNTAKWLRRIGIDPDENTWAKISAPSPFPAKNRPVSREYEVGRLTQSGKKENKEDVVATIRKLAERHDGQQGLIHTVSYDWAETLYEHLSDIAMLHPTNSQDAKDVVADWQSDDRDILLSPAMMEGVDLEGEECRWQALATVPYPSLGDPRADYLNQNDDSWFRKTTATRIVQSAGRAVRSKDDQAIYYSLDREFGKMRGHFPDWFRDAIEVDKLDKDRHTTQ
jgi:Rad3-related DNA helicase